MSLPERQQQQARCGRCEAGNKMLMRGSDPAGIQVDNVVILVIQSRGKHDKYEGTLCWLGESRVSVTQGNNDKTGSNNRKKRRKKKRRTDWSCTVLLFLPALLVADVLKIFHITSCLGGGAGRRSLRNLPAQGQKSLLNRKTTIQYGGGLPSKSVTLTTQRDFPWLSLFTLENRSAEALGFFFLLLSRVATLPCHQALRNCSVARAALK